MAWAPFGRLRIAEGLTTLDTFDLTELVVETAAVKVGTFVKKGSAANSCVAAGDGERAIGIVLDGGLLLRSSAVNGALESEFSDYKVGDKALVLQATLKPVLALTAQTTVTEGALVAVDTNAKATTTTTSNDYVVGKAIELVTDNDGNHYIRMHPRWQVKELI